MQRLLGIALIVLPLAGACKKSASDADNTGRNKVVEKTADQADKTGPAVDQMAKIRKAIMDDSTLSTNAHNAKVIVTNDTVTLEGAVSNADEKTKLETIAATASGLRVINNLQVNQ